MAGLSTSVRSSKEIGGGVSEEGAGITVGDPELSGGPHHEQAHDHARLTAIAAERTCRPLKETEHQDQSQKQSQPLRQTN